MNQKVIRTLDTIALILKDERQELIDSVHKVINEKKDGYTFDFNAAVENYRSLVIGPSIQNFQIKFEDASRRVFILEDALVNIKRINERGGPGSRKEVREIIDKLI